MSTLQHINSVVNYNWPEMSRRYPGFEKPQIVPAETLRGLAPVYLRSSIDQDPTSYFMFIAGNPLKGDCSREKACEFFDELFYEKLRMPSSYEANEGYSREEAIDKEVLPPATDTQFRNYYDEQMAKIDAENARKRRIDNLGFDPDDGNTIDVDDYSPAPSSRSVGQAQSSAVGMPKKIFYCVDFHCPAGGTLGYDGGRGGRLGGRRRPGGYLRESDSKMSDILAAYKKLPEGLKKDVEQIATSPDGVMVVKHKDGKFTVVEDGKVVMERVSADEVKKSGKLGQKQVTVVTKDELSKMLSECDDAEPEQMMKEFVEKKRKCGVKEDEYRRPKNQPHNLHQVDEGEDVEEDEYRRPKNQPHNLHRVDEKDAPAEYHNDFGSDMLACAKGMNDHDFNSAHIGVWSGFGFHAVVPTAFSGSHVTLEPSDDNMLTLPQFLGGLKKIGVKKLSDVKTLDIYGEDSEYAGFECDRNSIMKTICLKFSSKKGDPKDTFRDFLSEEDSKNEFESESEELNESMVRFCDRLIRG